MQLELGVLKQQQREQGERMTTRTDELIANLREQLESLKVDLEREKQQGEKVHEELSDYKAAWEEPLYENEYSFDVPPVPSTVPLSATPPVDRVLLDDFQFQRTVDGLECTSFPCSSTQCSTGTQKCAGAGDPRTSTSTSAYISHYHQL